MYHVHPKIYPAVLRVQRKEDQFLTERCRQLRGRLTPESVGVPSDYNCPYNKTLDKLNRLNQANSPHEKIHVLHDAVESVMEDAKAHFAKSLRIGGTVSGWSQVVGVVGWVETGSRGRVGVVVEMSCHVLE